MAIIGREAPADIIVAEGHVSCQHAEIRHLGDDLYQITDLDSTNGTYVNGQRITSTPVRLSDSVHLGDVPIDLHQFAHLIPQATQSQTPTEAESWQPSAPEPVVEPPPPVYEPPAAPYVAPPPPVEHVPPVHHESPETGVVEAPVQPQPEVIPPAVVPPVEPPPARPPQAAPIIEDVIEERPSPPAEIVRSPDPETRAMKEKPVKKKPVKAPPPQRTVQPTAQPGLGTELAVALAAQKSFIGRAFFVWVLYWLFWLPGFVMNVVWLGETKRVRNLTGENPSGTGCLWILIILHFWLPLALIVLVVLSGGALFSEIVNMF